jgi:predicted metalloprotease with PDZ domain
MMGDIEGAGSFEVPNLGLRVRSTTDGAEILEVAAGGPAERGGLSANMLISHVNGIALKGFSQETLAQLLKGVSLPGTVTVVGAGDRSLVP